MKGVNVVPTSTNGHFVKGATQVVDLDGTKGTFLVEGKSTLETANHTTLQMEESCLITCQHVYDPLAGKFVKAQD